MDSPRLTLASELEVLPVITALGGTSLIFSVHSNSVDNLATHTGVEGKEDIFGKTQNGYENW